MTLKMHACLDTSPIKSKHRPGGRIRVREERICRKIEPEADVWREACNSYALLSGKMNAANRYLHPERQHIANGDAGANRKGAAANSPYRHRCRANADTETDRCSITSYSSKLNLGNCTVGQQGHMAVACHQQKLVVGKIEPCIHRAHMAFKL